MKMNFKLALYQLRKKTNVLMAILFSLAGMIIFVLNTYKSSWQNSIDNSVYNYIHYKTIRTSIYMDNEEEKALLESIPHVTNVIHFFDFQKLVDGKEFLTDKYGGIIHLFSANNEGLPKIVAGTNFPDDEGYYMVCPQNFIPDGARSKARFYSQEDYFDIKAYLNKEINLDYNPYSDTEDAMAVKLVGLYKNNEYMYDENQCYANNKVIHDINLNFYSGNMLEYSLQREIGWALEVDNYTHVQEVKETLTNMGYKYEDLAFLDTNGINKTNNNIKNINYITILIIFIFIFLLFRKDYLEDKKYYKTLFKLGYNNKEIKKVYISSLILKILMCLISYLIFIILAMIIGSILVKIFPLIFNKWEIIYNYNCILIMCLILLVNFIIHLVLKRKES